MLFLVDESMGSRFATLLKNAGHNTVFVGDKTPEATDADVLAFAARENRIILTADKDFGMLAVQLGIPAVGVVLFRTVTRKPDKRFELAKSVLDKAEGMFVVVKEGRIRMRRLSRM